MHQTAMQTSKPNQKQINSNTKHTKTHNNGQNSNEKISLNSKKNGYTQKIEEIEDKYKKQKNGQHNLSA